VGQKKDVIAAVIAHGRDQNILGERRTHRALCSASLARATLPLARSGSLSNTAMPRNFGNGPKMASWKNCEPNECVC